jgi:hypothetical protein
MSTPPPPASTAKPTLTPTPFALVVLIALLSLVLQGMAGVANDPGLGWHLATGEFIATHHQVPLYDPFLSIQRRWVCDQWLADLLLYKLYTLGSWPLLYGVITSIYLLTYLGLLRTTTCAGVAAPLSATIACFLAFRLSGVHFIIRPVLFSFPLFTLALFLLRQLQKPQPPTQRIPPPPLLLCGGLMLTFLLWAQIHPSFILGLVLLAILPCATVLDAVLARILHRQHQPGQLHATLRTVSIQALCFATCAAATLINPNGATLHTSILTLGRSTYFMQLNSEWLPITFTSLEGQIFLFICAVLTLGALTFRGKLPWRSFDYITLLLFGYLANGSVRIVTYFSILSVTPLTQLLHLPVHDHAYAHTRVLRLARPTLQRLSRLEASNSILGQLLLCAAAVGALVCPAVRGDLLIFRGPFGPAPSQYPYQALAAITTHAHNLPLRPTVLTTPNWGGFVVFGSEKRLAPQIDDRNTLLGEAAYRDFMQAKSDPDTLLQYQRTISAHYILLPTATAAVQALLQRGTPAPLYTDTLATVFAVQAGSQPNS